MDVLQLIDKFDQLIRSAKHRPFSDDVRVNKQQTRAILDEMRTTIPEEIREARWIAQEREELLSEAKREADRIAKQAREHQAELVSQHELIRQAKRAAEEIIEGAHAREREIRLGAEDYADKTLDALELNLAKFIAAIQRGRERLRDPDERAGVG
jgi:cell division septum initiation protein DivIVA